VFPGNPLRFAFDERYVYISDFNRGLIIAQIESPTHFVEVLPGTPMAREQPSVQGDLVCVGGGHYLVTMDVHDRHRPVVLGYYPYASLEIGGHITDVALRGNRAFLAASGRAYGFFEIDLTDLRDPRLVRTYVAGETPTALFLSNEFIFVASGKSGMFAFDLSEPNASSGRYPTAAAPMHFCSGNIVLPRPRELNH
jgi:hypothetical protein